MSSLSFDTIIIGLGAMGSAAAYHLACRGDRVLGIDQFQPPHTMGSSHGQTRIIREAYFEHPLYVPLIQRAFELWLDLENRANERLLLTTGGLMIGPETGVIFPGARASALEHRLPHEVLSAQEIKRRFPALKPASNFLGLWEPRAGILFPEKCIDSHLKLAEMCGALLQTNERVIRWQACSHGYEVVTPRQTYTAERLLFTAGSWVQSLLPELRLPLTVERQVLLWFSARVNAGQFAPDRCPVHLWETDSGEFFYGFPDLGDGVKLARHHSGSITTPDTLDREVHAEDESALRNLAQKFIPDANGPLRSGAVCAYTNTPDSHFWIDQHPEHPQVWIGSPCSGHGFKFASVMGEVLADLVTERPSGFDLSLFRRRTFDESKGAGSS